MLKTLFFPRPVLLHHHLQPHLSSPSRYRTSTEPSVLPGPATQSPKNAELHVASQSRTIAPPSHSHRPLHRGPPTTNSCASATTTSIFRYISQHLSAGRQVSALINHSSSPSFPRCESRAGFFVLNPKVDPREPIKRTPSFQETSSLRDPSSRSLPNPLVCLSRQLIIRLQRDCLLVAIVVNGLTSLFTSRTTPQTLLCELPIIVPGNTPTRIIYSLLSPSTIGSLSI